MKEQLGNKAFPVPDEIACAVDESEEVAKIVMKMIMNAPTERELHDAEDLWRHTSNLLTLIANLIQARNDESSIVSARGLIYANICIMRDTLLAEFVQGAMKGIPQKELDRINALREKANAAISEFERLDEEDDSAIGARARRVRCEQPLEHPEITRIEATGYPSWIDTDPEPALCPMCGRECETIYTSDQSGEVVGCDECLTTHDAWDTEEWRHY